MLQILRELERFQLANIIPFGYQQCIQRTDLECFPDDCLQRIRRVSGKATPICPFQVREKKRSTRLSYSVSVLSLIYRSTAMGNQASSALGLVRPTTVAQPTPLQLTGQISKRTHRCSNKDHSTESARRSRTVSRSVPVDLQKHSLLSIPPELRNCIYAHLLNPRDCIVLSPMIHTKITGIALLRTCTQLHDEAASFFYAKNSFQCYIRKSVIAQSVSTASIQLPHITSSISPRFFRDPLAMQGGIFFPAPRYHQYLTQLTIYFKVSIRDLAFPDPEKGDWGDAPRADLDMNQYIRRPCDNTAITSADMGKKQQAIQHEVFRVYQEMKGLWRDKEGVWVGRVTMPARSTTTDDLEFWIELTADEHVTHE